MSSDAKFLSVEVVDRRGPGEGLYRPSGPDLFMRVEIDKRVYKARIDIEELKKWNDALDNFPKNKEVEKVKAFVRELPVGRKLAQPERTAPRSTPACSRRIFHPVCLRIGTGSPSGRAVHSVGSRRPRPRIPAPRERGHDNRWCGDRVI